MSLVSFEGTLNPGSQKPGDACVPIRLRLPSLSTLGKAQTYIVSRGLISAERCFKCLIRLSAKPLVEKVSVFH